MVRLKSAYIIKCDDVIKDTEGKIAELHCSYIPESKSGSDTSGINVKGTLQWVNAATAIKAEIRLYDRLFKVEDVANAEGDFKDYINPDSLQIISNAYAEPALKTDEPSVAFQFIRKGYFVIDRDSTSDQLVFNRTVSLKDGWAKEAKKA
jgi:glutaminyl-tRNA synthetase